MSDHRIFLSGELPERDDCVLASAAHAPAMATYDDAALPHRLRKDRLKPNNRWRAFLEQKRKA